MVKLRRVKLRPFYSLHGLFHEVINPHDYDSPIATPHITFMIGDPHHVVTGTTSNIIFLDKSTSNLKRWKWRN